MLLANTLGSRPRWDHERLADPVLQDGRGRPGYPHAGVPRSRGRVPVGIGQQYQICDLA